MSYTKKIPLLYTTAHNNLPFKSHLIDLFSNDTHLRMSTGMVYAKLSKRYDIGERMLYMFLQDMGTKRGSIDNETLSIRLQEYITHHQGSCGTNCSVLAHYLTTGDLIPFDHRNNSLVVEQNMITYTGQKICVGDIICVIYWNKKRAASRKTRGDIRKRYFENKENCTGGSFLKMTHHKKRTCAPEELQKFFSNPLFSDFNFLTCVATNNGKPVFVNQTSYDLPHENFRAPVIFTHAGHYPFRDNVPASVFISCAKNRKQKL